MWLVERVCGEKCGFYLSSLHARKKYNNKCVKDQLKGAASEEVNIWWKLTEEQPV